MPVLTVEQLTEQRLHDAWPILAIPSAAPPPRWWAQEVADLIRGGGGVLVARPADGLVHGLATYEPLDGPRGERVLAVLRLITVELSMKQPVRQELLRTLERVADALGCRAMALPLPIRLPVSRADRSDDRGELALPLR